MQALLRWLRGLGAEGLEDIRIAPSEFVGGGWGVLAARDLEGEGPLLHLPEKAVLTAGSSQRSSAGSDENWFKLAEALLRERARGENSPFAPYIATLPHVGALAPFHPLLWPAAATPQELLAGSAHGRRAAERALQSGAAALKYLRESGATDSDLEARWAVVVVDSRAFTFEAGTEDQELALVPLFDIINTFSLLRDGEPLWHCDFEPEGGVSTGATMQCRRPIAAGEEVVHCYDANSSADLWMTYGFLPSGGGTNLFEKAALSLDLPALLAGEGGGSCASSPECRDAQRRTLEQAGIDVSKPLVLDLPTERGEFLMPVARLFACGSAAEVEALGGDVFESVLTGCPPKNLGIELELRARRLVASWAEAAIATSDNAAEKLRNELLADPGSDSQMRELREMALRLLELERPVLVLEQKVSESFCRDGARAAGDVRRQQQFEADRWDEDGGWMNAG